jgi:hypothetical protein
LPSIYIWIKELHDDRGQVPFNMGGVALAIAGDLADLGDVEPVRGFEDQVLLDGGGDANVGGDQAIGGNAIAEFQAFSQGSGDEGLSGISHGGFVED